MQRIHIFSRNFSLSRAMNPRVPNIRALLYLNECVVSFFQLIRKPVTTANIL